MCTLSSCIICILLYLFANSPSSVYPEGLSDGLFDKLNIFNISDSLTDMVRPCEYHIICTVDRGIVRNMILSDGLYNANNLAPLACQQNRPWNCMQDIMNCLTILNILKCMPTSPCPGHHNSINPRSLYATALVSLAQNSGDAIVRPAA